MKIVIMLLTLLCSNAYSGFATINPKAGPIDILFVIDDSGSMAYYQSQLSNNLEKLLSPYQTQDLHLGIITTDTDTDPQSRTSSFPKLHGSDLRGNFNELISQLRSEVLVSDSGSATEKPLHAAIGALEAPVNKGFLRAGSQLKIIFITDEHDQSEMDEFDFIRRLSNVKNPSDISISGILIDKRATGMRCKLRPADPPEKQNKLVKLIRFFKGNTYSLCSEDWSSFEF